MAARMTLDEICDLRREFVDPSGIHSERYVALENIEPGRTTIRSWEENVNVRSTKSRFEPKDVLYGKLRPYLRKAALAEWKGVCSTELLVLRPRADICDSAFLAFLLHSKEFLRHAISNTSGVNHPRVSWAALSQFEFSMLPLHKQRAVAAILAKIQDAIGIQERIVSTLEELTSATMAKVFHEEGELPGEALGELAKVGNGSTPNRNEQSYWEAGSVPWLTSTRVHDVIILQAYEHVTERAQRECHLPMVPAGSVVVAITGQGKTLGNAALVTFETCINQHLAYVTIQSERLNPEYLLFFLRSRYRELRAAAQGGGTTKGALTCGYLKTLRIPVPEMEEQRSIASAFQSLHEAVSNAERKRALLEELFSSTLEALISGAVEPMAAVAVDK